jgi:hypothetical protein
MKIRVLDVFKQPLNTNTSRTNTSRTNNNPTDNPTRAFAFL